jgi:hypothetical protein
MRSVPAVEVIISIIPLSGVVLGAVIIFFYLLWSHRRQMFLIETKQYTPVSFNIQMFSLITGLLLSSVGLCLTLFFVLFSGLALYLLCGLVPLSMGIALLVFFALSKRLPQ